MHIGNRFGKEKKMNVLIYGLIITLLSNHQNMAAFIYDLVFVVMAFLILKAIFRSDGLAAFLRILIAILLLGVAGPWMIGSVLVFVWFIWVLYNLL